MEHHHGTVLGLLGVSSSVSPQPTLSQLFLELGVICNVE
jgi:hypothetical protein